MWHKPTDPLPTNLYVGDRIALIVVERAHACAPLKPFIVMLTAGESGWTADDPTFNGYGPTDGVAWATEKDLLAAAADVYEGT